MVIFHCYVNVHQAGYCPLSSRPGSTVVRIQRGVGCGGPWGWDLGPRGESHGCFEGAWGWRWRGSTGRHLEAIGCHGFIHGVLAACLNMLKLFEPKKGVGMKFTVIVWFPISRKCWFQFAGRVNSGRNTVEKLEGVGNMGEEPDGKFRIDFIFTFELGKIVGARPNWA